MPSVETVDLDAGTEGRIKIKGVGQECPTHTITVSDCGGAEHL
jgi:hypothetical protein